MMHELKLEMGHGGGSKKTQTHICLNFSPTAHGLAFVQADLSLHVFYQTMEGQVIF